MMTESGSVPKAGDGKAT